MFYLIERIKPEILHSEHRQLILHGLANHAGLYDGFVPAFLERNISVYRYDARGHGKSEGKPTF